VALAPEISINSIFVQVNTHLYVEDGLLTRIEQMNPNNCPKRPSSRILFRFPTSIFFSLIMFIPLIVTYKPSALLQRTFSSYSPLAIVSIITAPKKIKEKQNTHTSCQYIHAPLTNIGAYKKTTLAINLLSLPRTP
jgi:hypothetical protein